MARSSSQKFIARARAPRVEIGYDIELYGAEKRIAAPFVVGVLADLAGRPGKAPPSLKDRRFLEIDIDNFDDRLRGMTPRVAFNVPDTATEGAELAIDITFESLDDFSPAAVAGKVDRLGELLEERTRLLNLLSYMDGKAGAESLIGQILGDTPLLREIASEVQSSTDEASPEPAPQPRHEAGETPTRSVDALSALLGKAFKPKSEAAQRQSEIAVRTLARHALRASDSFDGDPFSAVDRIIQQIDMTLTRQLNPILHHPEFRRLEGAWRGLHYLVSNTETDEMLKIRFLSISKEELGRAIERYRGTAWDQSPLYRKIHDEEINTMGGQPYGCLIGDYEFGVAPQDVGTLQGMAQIAEAAHAPFITGGSPSAMHLDSWQEIAKPRDLTRIFTTPEYAQWRSLRESEESRYLALTMPRFLARLPYGEATNPVDEFRFQEETPGRDSSAFTWCNSAYAMGVNITRAFKTFGWCARIRGLESGGAVDGLPVWSFPTDDGGTESRSPTEVSISDRWEAELARSGFMPLVHRKNTDSAVFIDALSFHKPEEYDDPDATAAAALAARLPYLLACCRFAQHLRCIVRDGLGSFSNRTDMERRLNRWVSEYVDTDPATSTEDSKARRPLADAEIVLEEIEGDPSHYTAKIYLRPSYQLEGLPFSLRLVSKLPSERLV